MSLPFPQSKNHLLSVVDYLPYTERFNYASRLGRDHKGKPALATLVNDLLKHPDPPVPEMDTEEGFTEILPSQRTSIAKYYNEDQLALAIAASAGMFDVIKERLTSPSTFFDHFVFSSYIRMTKDRMQVDSGKKGAVEYYASDDDVIKAILAAVPARQRLLIQEVIQAKRLSIIAKVVPELRALPNYPAKSVAHIIHACDSETVKDFLFENKFQQVGQVWNKIIKFHVIQVLELLEEDLQSEDTFERNLSYDAYQSWAFQGTKTIPRFLKNKVAMEMYLDIVLKYPILECSLYPKPETTEKADYTIPSLLESNFQRFMTALPEKTTQVMLMTVWKYWVDGSMRYHAGVGNLAFTMRAGYSYINRYIKKALELTPQNVKLVKHTQIHNFIQLFCSNLTAARWNSHQTLFVIRQVVDYMQKHRPNVDDKKYYEFSEIWSTLLSNSLKYFQFKIQVLNSTKKEDQTKKAGHLKSQLEKYRKGLFELLDKFCPLLFENVYRGLHHSHDYEHRKINVTLDTYSSAVLNVVTDTIIAQYVFEKNRGDLVRLITEADHKERKTARSRYWNFILKLLTNFQNSRNHSCLPEWKEAAHKAIVEVFNFINKSYAEDMTPEEIQTLFNYEPDLTYEMFFPKLQLDPLANTKILMSMYGSLSKERKIAVYKWFVLDNLVHLVKNNPDHFVTMVSALPIEVINEAIMHMLTTPNLIDENTRNKLVSFQDINDIKIRNSLQKMSNSNNVAERNGALTSLIMATARTKDLKQVNRTLKFIREKIKNESMANRAEILEVVRTEGHQLMLPKDVGPEQFAFWNDMLTDALESPDLDQDVYDKSNFNVHPVLKFFEHLATLGIDQCVAYHGKNFDLAIFEFCVEIMWRLTVFRHGEKKAAQDLFLIKFDTYQFQLKLAEETDDANEPMTSGEWGGPVRGSRARGRGGRQQTNSRHTAVRAHAAPVQEEAEKSDELEVPGIRKLLPHYIAAYEKRIAEKNPDWKQDLSYFSLFLSATPSKWPQIPELVDIVRAQINRVKTEANKDDDGLYIIPSDDKFNTILNLVQEVPNKLWEGPIAEVIDLGMHSRFATKLLPKWVDWKEEGAKKAREFKACRDKYIPELLKISPSAIHLRFVWRHLVTYMQNKLDDYIGKRKTFRGVFYVGPEQRKFDRSCLKTPETRRSGGRARTQAPAKGRKATKAGVITKSSGNPQQDVDEEREKEKKIREELEDTPEEFWDHEDFFYLEACFGLQRLLPRQVNVLAKDWEVQTLNADRAVPYRVKCTARWTLMPTISYNDVVVFLNTNENATERHKGLSVNLIEALLRGVMRNDEPIAPLNFLLSPKFLGSDRSRVSVYAISQCLPYMPLNGLTNMLKLCLTGKRRQQLKISSYKEIIRLLAAAPTDEHLDIIFREWKRPDLHRDVRIAILVSAMKFLHSKDERFNKIAWRILEHGATLHDQHEILTALLGTKEENGGQNFSMAGCSTYFRNSRIEEHLGDLAKQDIPSQHAERFGEKVVGVIASTAKNDDIKFLAVGSLQNWPVIELSINMLQKYLMDMSPESLLYSDIPAERDIFDRRWRILVSGLNRQSIVSTPNCQKMIELVTFLCDKINSTPSKERVQRVMLVGLAKELLSILPVPGVSVCHYKPGELDQIFQIFKEKLHNIFAVQVFQHKRAELTQRARSKQDSTIDKYLALLHEITVYACTYPTVADTFYLNMASEIIRDNPSTAETVLRLFELNIDASKSPISKTADYQYLLRRVALNGLTSYKYICRMHPEQTLKFWQSIFDFAAERKDIPREHLKASQIFDFLTLARQIAEVLAYDVNSPRYEAPIYPDGTAKIIGRIADRYLEVLKGKSGDAFGEQVGKYLLTNSKVIAEAAPEECLFQIAHNLLLTTSSAFAIIPKIVTDLENANKTKVVFTLMNDIITRSLDRSKPDWGAFYVAQSRGLALTIIPSHDRFARAQPETVERFVEDVIPNLTTFELHGSYDNEIAHKASLVWKCLNAACGYDRSYDNLANASAFRVMNTYLPKYLSQEKPTQGMGTPEEQAVRVIAFELIARHPVWITKFHLDKVAALTDAILRESSHNITTKSDAMTKIEGLAASIGSKGTRTLPPTYFEFFSDIINLHKRVRDVPKNKQYIETSFDLAFNLMKTFPSLIRQNHELSFYFLNWAISMYIREPDVTAILQAITNMLTNDTILPDLKDIKEDDIVSLVKFITTFADLKHQNLVLPQQTLLPMQSFPQYTHVSLHLAFNMIRRFGGHLRETKEKEYVWRNDFVALLDKMCAVNDPLVKLEAWNTEIVYPK